MTDPKKELQEQAKESEERFLEYETGQVTRPPRRKRPDPVDVDDEHGQ